MLCCGLTYLSLIRKMDYRSEPRHLGFREKLENHQTDLRRLLVLRGPSLEAGGVVSILQQCFDVEIAESFEDALNAMRKNRFLAVLAETGDFLPIERGAVAQRAAAVLDTLGDGRVRVRPGWQPDLGESPRTGLRAGVDAAGQRRVS